MAARRYDCRNRTPCFLASRVSPLIAACKSFASVGKVMFLGCTVVSTVTRAKSFVRSAPLSCATRKLSARRSSSLLPRRLRQWLRSERLEELLSSEVLEIRVIDPALARTFVGQAVNMLEQKKPDHKPCRNSRPTTVAVQRCDLAVDKVPVDLTRELHQLVPHVDDLVQLRTEQIIRSCRLVLLRPHRSLRYGDRITLLDSRESRKQNCKLPAPQTLKPCNLRSPKPPENDSRSEA